MNQLLSMQKINLNITLNFPETAPCQTSVAMIMGGNPTKFDLILKLQLSLRFLDFLGFPKQLPTPRKILQGHQKKSLTVEKGKSCSKVHDFLGSHVCSFSWNGNFLAAHVDRVTTGYPTISHMNGLVHPTL